MGLGGALGWDSAGFADAIRSGQAASIQCPEQRVHHHSRIYACATALEQCGERLPSILEHCSRAAAHGEQPAESAVTIRYMPLITRLAGAVGLGSDFFPLRVYVAVIFSVRFFPMPFSQV